jgi:hypothetical protein
MTGLSRLLVAYGLGCFAVAALFQILVFFGMIAVIATNGILREDAVGADVLALAGYLASCVFGTPLVWFILIAQSWIWAPVLFLASTRGAVARLLAVLAAPAVGAGLFVLGLVATKEYFDTLTVLGSPLEDAVLIEAVALTIVSVTFFAMLALIARVDAKRP